MILSLILGVLLGAVAVIFILQNVAVVTVTFLSWQITGSLAVVLLLAIVCGIVITLLMLLPSLIRDYFYLSAIKKRERELQNDLANTKQSLAKAVSRSADTTVVTEQRVISS
jgi:putative membrane protein